MDRESILDLSKYLNNSVRVELSGGRKGMIALASCSYYLMFLVQGVLKGFDQLNNLVLEQAVEEKGKFMILIFKFSNFRM